MTMTIEDTAIKFRTAFQMGLSWRKAGKTIQTREQFIEARTVIGTAEEKAFNEDMYLAYSKGYRSFIPTPREVTVNNGW